MTFHKIVGLMGLLASPACGAKLEVQLASAEQVRARLERGVVKPGERQATMHALFKEVGCEVEEQRVSRHASNVICTLPGETDRTILVGGHFDFVEQGQGVVDDWSGAALLPSLFSALRGLPRRHTLRFVAFAEEEKGLVGSSRFVKELSKEDRGRIVALVNLECLGMSSTKIWVHRATPALVADLVAVANSIPAKVAEMDVEKIGDDDSHPFFSAHIPTITLHSITQETLRIIHSNGDQLKAIRNEDYYETYRLTALFLAYLDAKPE